MFPNKQTLNFHIHVTIMEIKNHQKINHLSQI